MSRPSARLVGFVAGLLLCCCACVSLPDSGDLEVGDDQQTSTQDSGIPYDPRPPQPGEQAGEIVTHFLDAMQANPTTTAVARQFLSEEAQESWRPERATITYDDFTSPSGSSQVQVQLLGVHRLDGRGTWGGAVPSQNQTLSFEMTIEDGEWRIDDPPNAMIVSDEYFEARYRQVSLYFVDPTAKVVVPEPVFVPRSGQLAAVLMRGLLLGPDPRLRGVVHTYIPDGLTLDLSRPVAEDGVAEVSLRGTNAATQLDPEIAELMAVQIAWTLRQDPSVRRVRLTINDTPLTVAGQASDFDVSIGAEYNPVGSDTAQEMFGLRDGRLAAAVGGGETLVTGPLGRRNYGASHVAVDLTATDVAAVTNGGTVLRRAPVDDNPNGVPRVVLTGVDLLRPAWDLNGRLWVVDRAADGARISYLSQGRQRRVRVPGLTGAQISRFLVSRDGTRLLAVVRRPRGDVVMQSRLRQDGSGIRGTRARVVYRDADEKVRIRDIAWFSPTEVVLVRGVSKGLSQVATFSVDGSTAVQSGEVPVELVRDNVVALVGSPHPAAATLAIARSNEIHELGPDDDAEVPAEDLVSLGYVG